MAHAGVGTALPRRSVRRGVPQGAAGIPASQPPVISAGGESHLAQILFKCGPESPDNEKDYLIEICSKDTDANNQGFFFFFLSLVQ